MVYLAPGEEQSDQQGAVQVTVFSPELNPLAERLVYRNHGQNLQIDVTPDQEQYGPRDEVVLNIRTTDPSGEPLAAELALSVVDDAVISMADDQEGHMLSRLYLEPELIDSPKDPSFYFDSDEELAARSMDLVMGTKGHRRFEWTQVWNPPQLVAIGTTGDAYGMGALGYIDNAQMIGVAGGMAMEDNIPMMAMEAEVPRMAMAVAEEAEMVPPPAPPQEVLARPRDDRRAARKQEADKVGAGEAFFGVAAGGGGRVQAGARAERGRVAHGEWNMDEDMMGDVAFGHGGLGHHNKNHGWASVRVFPAPDYSAGFTGIRSDFRDTVHWEPSVRTDEEGSAEVRFYLSDAVTSFRVTAEGVGSGYAGHDEATLSSVLPVSIATLLPSAVSVGDRIDLPVTLSSTRGSELDVSVVGEFFSSSLVARDASGSLSLDAYGSGTYWIPIDIGDGNESVSIRLSAEGGGLSDTLERELKVVPSGFPRSWSASGESDDLHRLHFQLDDVVPESLTASVTWHPSPVSTLIQGMEGMIRTPGGCFEQTSSSNWPNVAILNYLDAHDGDPRLVVQSSKALQVGYDKLTGYQVGAGGFETWGSGPGKEALSAFGLLQFHDMQKVFPVADQILSKDAKYLLAQRDGKGGFKNSGESAHGYGSAPPDILNGFITYALVETGHKASLKTEIDHQAKIAQRTEDPYVLALAVRSLQGGDHPGAHKASQKLADLQAEDGSFPGAKSSITRSYEANLLVESTALAALALMDTGKNRKAADKAAEWLVNNRQGAGTWGATQATALALFALTRHAEVSSVPASAGVISLEVNGTIVGSLAYDAEQSDALTIDGWEDYLLPGDNSLVLRQEDGTPLPFTVDVSWTSITPTTSPGAELSLQTELDRSEMGMGDTVRMTARIDNEAGRIVPSPIARIGIPAGLEAQTWQLKQLQERGEIAFFETRPREVTIYWDGIHTDDSHEIALDLVAVIPGSYTAPASSAYPYYNDDEKAWDAGVKVEITR
jgi:hypothetical protein